MNRYLRFLLGSPQRAIVTLLVSFGIFGMIAPQTAGSIVAEGWNNFWIAFKPLFQQLLQLAIVVGGICLIVRGVFKKPKSK
ncbi:MAG: hypothetical protein PHF79_03880 [Candidatus Pacebacteria bacterium]|nr:hypothetical protein [Candidatus Paceibacterota bacterium]